MLPDTTLNRFASAVSKRCGICSATVKQVLPAVFDEIRYQVCEGKRNCVQIDSFGTFLLIDIPEREYHYTYKCDKIVHLPATKKFKFVPAKNVKEEGEQAKFDPTRTAFRRRPSDPPLGKRSRMMFYKDKYPIKYYGAPKSKKKKTDEIQND